MRGSSILLLLLSLGCSAGEASSQGSSAGAGGSEGGGGGGQGGGASDQALADCKQACATVDGLKCPQNTPGDCDKLCEKTATIKACEAAFATYSSCAKSAPWKCEGGLAQLSDCAKPQQELTTCLSTKGTGSGTTGTPGHFFCPNASCDGASSERACCLKLDITKPGGLDARCVPSIDQCGQDSRWECDGPDDCGGRPCCWSNPSTGSGQIVLGFCRDSCNLFAGEKETCQDKCTGGLFCCKLPGDDVGTCVQNQDACKPEEKPQD